MEDYFVWYVALAALFSVGSILTTVALILASSS